MHTCQQLQAFANGHRLTLSILIGRLVLLSHHLYTHVLRIVRGLQLREIGLRLTDDEGPDAVQPVGWQGTAGHRGRGGGQGVGTAAAAQQNSSPAG